MSNMPGSIVSYPGVMQHAQQVALALHEGGDLQAFATAFAFNEQGALARLLRAGGLPGSDRALRQLQRRSIQLLPRSKLCTYPFWEVARTLAAQAGAGAITVDRLWDRMAHSFDQAVARRHVPGARAVHAFEYTALATFEAAKRQGVQRILHLPSLDSLQFEELRQREHAQWPELARPDDAYFAARFQRRYDRRRHEIEQADLVIANSSLTARSHIEAGADPSKFRVVPLASPIPIPGPASEGDTSKPLIVVWAGAFKLGKGAHYFMEAWRRLKPGRNARAWVYGSVNLPQRLLNAAPDGLEFRGPVSQGELFNAFERADVLAFPTLSDGFGMVVTEAFSRALPVITTDQAGAADLLEEGHNGLRVKAADPDALKDALQWCLDHRAELAHMRHGALATARRHQWTDYRRAMRDVAGMAT